MNVQYPILIISIIFHQVELGRTIESSYSQWQCGSSSTPCYGACIATSQVTKDVLTVSASVAQPLTSTGHSHLVAVKLINPTTEAIIQAINVTDRLDITIPVTTAQLNLTAYRLEVCALSRRWNL